jgi:hypothetical protein
MRWEVVVYTGKDAKTGKYQQLSRTVHGTEEAARATERMLMDSVKKKRQSDKGRQLAERLSAAPSKLRTYEFPLRPDALISVDLPVDLNADEAERLVAWLRSLAL